MHYEIKNKSDPLLQDKLVIYCKHPLNAIAKF